MEDVTEKSVLTPGPLAAARELLGEMLLDMHKPAQALAQFEATRKKEPRRFWSLYHAARAARLSGRGDLSRRYFGELLADWVHSDLPGRPEIQEARDALAKR